MTPVTVRIADNLTPRQLVDLHQQGRAVYRTAHIGNQYLSNLLLASIGLPLYLYDKTIVGKDTNYHPEVRIQSGTREKLTDQKAILVPYAEFSEKDVRKDTSTPARLHIGALKAIFGNENIFTESDLFIRYREKLYEIFSIAARSNRYPFLFNRYVGPCGCVTMKSLESRTAALSVRCEHQQIVIGSNRFADQAIGLIENLHAVVTAGNTMPATGGIIPSLPLTQVLCLLIGFWESGHTTTFELSGPDMVKYAAEHKFVHELSSIFELLQKHAPSELSIPDGLQMELVPTADFRFGYHTGHAKSEMCALLADTIFKMQLEKRRMLSTYTSEARETLVADFNTVMKSMLECFRRYRAKWDLSYDIHAGIFFSQHDLLNTTKLTVPDVFMDMSFRDMKKMYERLSAIQ